MIPTTGKRRPRPEAWHARLYVAGRTPTSAATPTLVRWLPPPIKKFIGDLSSRERVLVALDMRLDG